MRSKKIFNSKKRFNSRKFNKSKRSRGGLRKLKKRKLKSRKQSGGGRRCEDIVGDWGCGMEGGCEWRDNMCKATDYTVAIRDTKIKKLILIQPKNGSHALKIGKQIEQLFGEPYEYMPFYRHAAINGNPEAKKKMEELGADINCTDGRFDKDWVHCLVPEPHKPDLEQNLADAFGIAMRAEQRRAYLK
jgi:hypothetical protein